MGYWKFAAQNRIEELSFNAVLERFHGYGINGLIRENIQNSLDGKLPDIDLPVEVIIEKAKIESSLIPGIEEIKARIKVLKSANTYANDTINHMQSRLVQEVVEYISFEDRNTKGLKGAEKGYSKDYNNTYSAYAYSKGIHNTDTDSEFEKSRGGSHGIGKIASNAASDLYVMYFANCDEEGNKHLGGTAQLIEHTYEDQEYRATGYFTDETIDNHFIPYKNTFDRVFAKDVRGLKIIIPFLRENFNDDNEIIKAICDNFFLSIYQEKLVVRYNGININKDSLSAIIFNPTYYVQELENMKDNFTPLYLDTYLNKEKFLISILDANRTSYDFNLYFQYDTSILKGRVAVIRTIGMKIEDRKILNSATKPFNAVLIPNDPDGDSFLKSLENESHSELTVDHIKDAKELRNAKKFLSNLNSKIRKILDDYIRNNNPTDGKIDTKDIIYDIENKFKTDLKSKSKIINLSQSVEEKPLVKYETKKDKKDKDDTKDKKEIPKVKPKTKKVKKTDKDNVIKELIKVQPHMVRRFIYENKEFLNINLVGQNITDKATICNLSIKVIDGQGKECDNELNINKDYSQILDVQSGNHLSSEGDYVKEVTLKNKNIGLEMDLSSSYNKTLKFLYYVEV